MLSFITVAKKDVSPLGIALRSGIVNTPLSAQEWGDFQRIVLTLLPLIVPMLALDLDEYEARDEIAHFKIGKIFKKIGQGIKKVAGSGLLNFIPGIGPIASAALSAIGGLGGSKGAPQPQAQPQYQPYQPAGVPTYLPQYQTPSQMPAPTVYAGSSAYMPEQGSAMPVSESEVVEARRYYVSTAQALGARRALEGIQRNYPDIFELFLTMAEYTTRMGTADMLYTPGTGRPFILRDEACSVCKTKLGDFSGRITPGQFYKSSLIDARVSQDMGGGVFGEVNLSRVPFKVRINGRNSDGRARIALSHELAHVANKVYKLGLNHDKVHDLGVFYGVEGIPLLNAFERVSPRA